MEENGSAVASMDVAASENVRPAAFRSWVEDYRSSPEPIDRAAFAYRKMQRMLTARVRSGKRPVGGAHVQSRNVILPDIEAAEAAERRQADPVLSAQLHLQRRGYVVFRASVRDSNTAGWIVNHGRPIGDAALMATAQARGWTFAGRSAA